MARRSPASIRRLLSLLLAFALPASLSAQVVQKPAVSAPLGVRLAASPAPAVSLTLLGTASLQPRFASLSPALPVVSLRPLPVAPLALSPASPGVLPALPASSLEAAAPVASLSSPDAPQATPRKALSSDNSLPVVSRWRSESRDRGAGPLGTGQDLSELFDGASPRPISLDHLVADHFDQDAYGPSRISDERYASLLSGSWSLMATDARTVSTLEGRRGLASQNALLARVRRGDPETYSHMMRVGLLAGQVALEMGLAQSFASRLSWAGAFHDLGKMRRSVLEVIKKPGKLTPQERRIMEAHSGIGARKIFPLISLPEPIKTLALKVALNHHEREDGRGYPRRLRGGDIPLEAGIVAVADVFDALMENRPYRGGMTGEQAVSIMSQEAPARFSPEVWNAFLRVARRMLGVPAGKPEAASPPVSPEA